MTFEIFWRQALNLDSAITGIPSLIGVAIFILILLPLQSMAVNYLTEKWTADLESRVGPRQFGFAGVFQVFFDGIANILKNWRFHSRLDFLASTFRVFTLFILIQWIPFELIPIYERNWFLHAVFFVQLLNIFFKFVPWLWNRQLQEKEDALREFFDNVVTWFLFYIVVFSIFEVSEIWAGPFLLFMTLIAYFVDYSFMLKNSASFFGKVMDAISGWIWIVLVVGVLFFNHQHDLTPLEIWIYYASCLILWIFLNFLVRVLLPFSRAQSRSLKWWYLGPSIFVYWIIGCGLKVGWL